MEHDDRAPSWGTRKLKRARQKGEGARARTPIWGSQPTGIWAATLALSSLLGGGRVEQRKMQLRRRLRRLLHAFSPRDHARWGRRGALLDRVLDRLVCSWCSRRLPLRVAFQPTFAQVPLVLVVVRRAALLGLLARQPVRVDKPLQFVPQAAPVVAHGEGETFGLCKKLQLRLSFRDSCANVELPYRSKGVPSFGMSLRKKGRRRGERRGRVRRGGKES